MDKTKITGELRGKERIMARRFGIFREFSDVPKETAVFRSPQGSGQTPEDRRLREEQLKKRPLEELHVRTSFAERSGVRIQRFGSKALRTGGQLARSSADAQLESLVNSRDPAVRESVARRGVGLDRLLYDENPFVRAAVAEQRYGLDVLVRDADPYVRAAVARQGYGLAILGNDRSLVVQDAVWDFEHKGAKSMTVSDIVANAASRDFGVSRGDKEEIEMEFC